MANLQKQIQNSKKNIDTLKKSVNRFKTILKSIKSDKSKKVTASEKKDADKILAKLLE